MEEVTCIYRWVLVSVSAKTLSSPILRSFSRTFNTMYQKTRFSNTACEKHCSALTPSDALAENGWKYLSDIAPCLQLNRPRLQGVIEFNLKRLLPTLWIRFWFKYNVLMTSIDDAWTGKDKSRPRVALRWASLATCRISSLVTSRRISVRSVFVMTI